MSLNLDSRESVIFTTRNVLKDYDKPFPKPQNTTAHTWTNVTGNDVKTAALDLIRAGKDPAKDKNVQDLVLRWQLSQSGIAPALAASTESDRLANEYAAAEKALADLAELARADASTLATAANTITVPTLDESYSGLPAEALLHAQARIAHTRLSAYADAVGRMLFTRGIQVQGEHMAPALFALAPLTYKQAHRLELLRANVASPWSLAHGGVTIEPAGDVPELQARLEAFAESKRQLEAQVRAALPQWEHLGRAAYQDAITRAVNGEPIRDARGSLTSWAN